MKIRVIGPAHLNTGLGVHTRLVADALATQNNLRVDVLPFHESRFQTQYDAGGWGYNSGPYDANIFCMNYPSIRRLADTMPYVLGSARRNICFGAWELEKAPDSFAPLPNYVDAYFAQSRFVEEAFKSTIDIPVFYTPLPLSQLVIDNRHITSQYRRSTGEFCCGFVFSVDSTMTRKNPQAVLDAFERAFPANENVRLILKISVSRTGDRNYQSFVDFRSRIKRNRQVEVISENMSDIEYLNFIKNFSVYVSLHRSEGFGLTLLEAIGCDVPCLTTAYSGNVDFCVPENSVLVPYELTDLSPEDYHGQMQRWADASVKAAADGLIALRDGVTAYRGNLIETVEDLFPHRVGKLYSDCLEKVVAL